MPARPTPRCFPRLPPRRHPPGRARTADQNEPLRCTSSYPPRCSSSCASEILPVGEAHRGVDLGSLERLGASHLGKQGRDPARDHGLARAGGHRALGRRGTFRRLSPGNGRGPVPAGRDGRGVGRAHEPLRPTPVPVRLRDRARDPATPPFHGAAPVRSRPGPEPLRRGFDALRPKGYRLVGEVAELLGVSENTVRRMEAEGVIPKARRVELARGKSVRAFTATEVERIARSGARERWRAKHPGQWRWSIH
ncbi:MAG TPA: helix-turn-helix domain-containing protein [Kofleriaceae bacterium]